MTMTRFLGWPTQNIDAASALDVDQGSLRRCPPDEGMSQFYSTQGAPALTITPLGDDDEAAAFALARIEYPELVQERWDNFLCDWKTDQDGRGILAARNLRGAILGFVCWWVQPDLACGQRLSAAPFVTHERGVRPIVRQSLVNALSVLAKDIQAVMVIDADLDGPSGPLSL